MKHGALSQTLGAESQPFAGTGDFSNGNANVIELDQAAGRIVIEPSAKAGVNIWWHVRLTGLRVGQNITLVVNNVDKVAGDCNPVVSFDGQTWQRTKEATSPFTFTAKGPTATVARNIPYPYEQALALADAFKGNDSAALLTLCKSEKDRAVPMVRIGPPPAAADGRKLVWVMARQHAFESHSSWVADALARWAAGDSDEAKKFRAQFVLYVVPIMDVDSVAIGGAGKGQSPDFNHVWGRNPPGWRAVDAAGKLVQETAKTHPLAAFLDLHSPWYPEGSHWYPPIAGHPEATAIFGKFLEHFTKSLAAAPNLPASTLKPPSGDPKEQVTPSRYWAADLAADHGFAITMEVSHLKDAKGQFITLEGLKAFGEQTGKSLLATSAAAPAKNSP